MKNLIIVVLSALTVAAFFAIRKKYFILKWTEENKPVGERLGYPDCCIAAFCKQPPQLLKGRAPNNDKKRYKAGCVDGEFTGFIPCVNHANQILEGEITIHSLIDTGKRDVLLPRFPGV